MTSNNISMYFKVDAASLSSPELQKKIDDMGSLCLCKVVGEPTIINLGDKEKLILTVADDKSHATVRVYSHGLITLDIQHFIESNHNNSPSAVNMPELNVQELFIPGPQKQQISDEYIRALQGKLLECLGDFCLESNSLYAPIMRGQPVWPYIITGDERLLQVDYDEVVHDSTSQFQQISIIHSGQHGNVLLLDNDLMLGESDLIYTETLCCIGQEDYKDKEVLILGGGDGGILHELSKQNPKMITMVEIDEEVMKACRTHMRSVCGDALDNFTGPRHKILVEDCVKIMHQDVSRGKKYDYVINDLTEFPVLKALKGYGYDFETTSYILEMAIKLLKPDGKLLARGNTLSAIDYRKKMEEDVVLMGCDFNRRDVFVPSFHETYCLYEIWKK